MDQIAKSPVDERARLFQEAADLRPRIPSFVMEKDFWVCWTIKRIFTSVDIPLHLIFKGGTSLSKVFHVIDRFSEDVDLSFDRRELGFDIGCDHELTLTPNPLVNPC
ncbi:MAG: nucleotidyl transferase AbiEii/AbiGii toxin family protein [Candidatus Aureabacteria bacterium]|nr:nucleotidyl transferase AbiEii/AbiGii toxin family protein [Candidatus Auribacterota bacterium]